MTDPKEPYVPRPQGRLDKEIERLQRQYDQERLLGMSGNANVTKRLLDGLLKRQEAIRPRCSNCGEAVRYGSEHCRGANELNAWWICEKPSASAGSPDLTGSL